MKAMASLLINVVGGAGLVVGAGAGWLAVQGRLTSESLSQVPGLSGLAPEKPPLEVLEPAATPKDAGATPPGAAPPAGDDGASSAAHSAAAPKSGLVGGPLPVLPEPFSVTEVNEMLRASGQARADYESRAALLDGREREIARAERDLDERRREVEGIMARFEEVQERIAVDRARLEKDVVRLQQAETGNLKKLAALYEGMSEVAAAAALAQVDASSAAKILSTMQKRKAGKVLGAMTPALAAEVSDKMTRILDDSKSAPATSGASEGK